MSNYSDEEKRRIIAELNNGETSISDLSKKYHLSRITLYLWKKRLEDKENLSNNYKKGENHYKSIPKDVILKILDTVSTDPLLSAERIYQKLASSGIKVGYHGIQNILERYNLRTIADRQIYASSHADTTRIKQNLPSYLPQITIIIPKRSRDYTEVEKKYILAELSGGKSTQQEISKKYAISRITLYNWQKKLNQSRSLSYAYKKGSDHYRSLTSDLIEKVLDAVSRNPQYSVVLIYEYLKAHGVDIGYHGVQNILARYNLSTLEDRTIYASKFAPIADAPKPSQTVDTVSLPSLDQLGPQVLPGPPPPASIHGIPSPVPAVVPSLPQSFELQGKPSSRHFLTVLTVSSLVVFLGLSLSFNLVFGLANSHSTSETIGILFGILSLAVGTFFFLYSLKYYLTTAIVLIFSRNLPQIGLQKLNQPNTNNNTNNSNAGNQTTYLSQPGLIPDLSQVELTRHPFVSIHLPLFNEKRVVNRLLEAVTSMNYDNYEVIVADDSTDETTGILNDWRNHPLVKIIHRDNRLGFKGGALKEALKLTDPRTEFILVFDADFLPYPDTITQFLKYFQVSAGSLDFTQGESGKRKGLSQKDGEQDSFPLPLSPYPCPIAAVQGYQWHVLNKSENWITRGVRSEYAGSYVIERSGAEVYGGLKQIAGSVFMVRADILRLPQYQWGTSITEDFELTLKLYRDGYKVIYTPYIQAPSECVSTLKRLVRQRMRWAEGHSYNIRKLFKQMLFGRFLESDVILARPESASDSRVAYHPQNDVVRKREFIPSRLSFSEKLEFLYLSPYYLQSFFFIFGTFSWFLSEAVFKVRLPFWTQIWGWSLVLTNLLSLPLMNTVGLFLEESEEKDYGGIPSFILLSYILAPFQAYASVKGFLEATEGPWFRTPKTGKITDTLRKGTFYKFFQRIFAKEGAVSEVQSTKFKVQMNRYLSLATANNKFNDFRIKKRKGRWIGNLVLALVLVINLVVTNLTFIIPKSSLAVDRETIKVVNKADLEKKQTEPKKPQREEIKSQIMTKFNDGEVIFHKEPRLRYKSGDNELEFETIGIEGLGKMKATKPYKEGSVYTYPQVFNKVNLTYQVDSNTLLEEFELEEYQDFDYIEQELKLTGFVLVKDQDGIIKIADESGGNAKLAINQPFMYEKNNAEVKNTALTYQLEGSGRNYKLKKVLTEEGKKWLADPERKFPVVIDPVITSIYTSNVTNIDVKFGPNQRKIAYMPNATGGAAWYAFSALDGSTAQEINYNKCLLSTLCDETTDWSTVLVGDTGATDEYAPNTWVEGDVIWVSWHASGTDDVSFRALDTTSDTFNVLEAPATTVCAQASGGSLINTAFTYIAVGDNGDVVVGYSSTAGDAEADLWEVPTGTCTESSIESGSGMPASSTTMQPIAIAIGNKIHIIYDDAANTISHSVRDVSTNAWDFIDQVADNGNVLNDDFSVTTDGTNLWLFYMDAATTTVLQKCTTAGGSPCMSNGAGTWDNLTAPWTSGLTNTVTHPAITYFTISNVLRACILNDPTSAGDDDVFCKDSPSGSIAWGSAFALNVLPAATTNLDELSSVMSVPTTAAEQFAVVFGAFTQADFMFATVPENIWLYIISAPFVLLGLSRIKRRKNLLC